MANLFTLAILGAILAIVPFYLDQVPPFQKEYLVYNSGAVLITGASSGIGNHAAKYLATNHPAVTVFAGVRKEADADAIKAAGFDNLRAWMIDVADEASVDAAVAKIEEILDREKKPLIGIVNNAGVSSNAPLEFLPIPKLRQLLETNVVGPTYLTQKLTKRLRQTHGRVVQVSSVLGKVTMATRGAYCGSKFAFEAISDVLRLELAPFGCSVSVVEPAYVSTEIFGKISKQTQEIVPGSVTHEVYGQYFYRPDQAEKRAAQVAKADSPIVTSKAIDHALFHKHPRTRYAVANFDSLDAYWTLWINWLLPDRVNDYVKGKLFG